MDIKELQREFEDCTCGNAVFGLVLNDFTELYGEEKIKTALLYAKDLKDRYSVLWLNFEINR